MDDELDPVTRATIDRLRYLTEQAERDLNDAAIKAKTLRNALFEVEGTACKVAAEQKKRK